MRNQNRAVKQQLKISSSFPARLQQQQHLCQALLLPDNTPLLKLINIALLLCGSTV